MEVYACGNCGGALNIEEKATTVMCLYCGYTNNMEALSEGLEDFKREVAGWLKNIGAVGGSGMDLAMRRIYFQDNVYPGLCTEFSNLIGDAEDILDLPLFYLQVYGGIPDLVVSTSWSPSQGKPLKDFARKLESPDLLTFFQDPASQQLLLELKLRSLALPMLMDVVNLTADPSAENFSRCSNTLHKLADAADSLVKVIAANDETKDQQLYFVLLGKRFRNSAKAYLKFAIAITTKEPIEEKWLTGKNDDLGNLRASLSKLASISVTDRVLLDAGLENDISAITAGYNLARLYPTITEVPYNRYIEAITNLTNRTLFYSKGNKATDLSWFSHNMSSEKFAWFLSALHTTINRSYYRVMVPSEDMNPWIQKKNTAGKFYLYPFYILKVKAVLKSGFLLWKKGTEEEFFALCDAAFNLYPGFYEGDFPSLMTPGFKKMIGSGKETLIQSLMEVKGRKKPDSWIALPPSVSSQDAEAIYTAAHNFLEETDIASKQGYPKNIPRSYKRKGFDPGKVKALSAQAIELVFLPMVVTKSGSEILGKKLGLDDKLPHRAGLCMAFKEFLKETELVHK